MKKLILAFLLSFSLSAQTIPQDKMLHFSGCYIIGATTSTIASYHLPKKKAFWVGVISGTLIGLAKEIHDIEHGHADLGDLGADVIGASLGSFTVVIRF
tara:strand:- start:15 stop:311 length:297 start_codon:yes stop_codon:yes gene_type:complete